jgi:hypothetical protein
MTRENIIVSVNPDGIDGFKEKAIRHLVDLAHGRLDWQTVKRGVKLIWDEGSTFGIDSSVVKNMEVIDDAFGIHDLKLTTYNIEVPIVTQIKRIKKKEKVQFVEFPLKSRLNINLHDQQRIHTANIFQTDNKIIAAFTGATSVNEADYPNNGFYHQSRLYKTFDYAKSRKGALAILESGDLVVVDDIPN